jgi:hypothetical protein
LANTDNKKVVLNPSLPKPAFRLILVGHSGSGKSNVLKNLIFNSETGYADYFDFVFIFCGSVDDLDEYSRLGDKFKCHLFCEERQKYLKKKMKIGEKVICKQTTTNDELNELIRELEHNEFFKGKKSLFVFDDMIVSELLANTTKMNAIDSLFVRGRHFHASTIISTQKWTGLKQNLRTINATNVMLFTGIPKSNLKLIASELSGSYDDDEFISIYNQYTREKYSFILVNLKNTRDKYIQDREFNYIEN